MNQETQLKRRSGTRLSLQSFVSLLLGMIFCLQVNAGEPFEMRMHDADINGSYDIEDGDYSQGIRKLEKILARSHGGGNLRKVAVLSDLCVAYTMIRELEQASQYCDEAVTIGRSSGLAFNNRGVLNIARGDYLAAVTDFQRATEERGGGRIASRNLNRATDRVVAMRAKEMAVMAQASDSAKHQ
jgi:Flp pilus assembly protein TadD